MRSAAWGAILAGCAPKDSDTATDIADTTPIDTDTDSDTDSDTDPDTHDSAPPCAPSFSVGTGVTAFLGLENGDTITIVAGNQGLWHVETAGVVTGLGEQTTVLGALTDLRTGAQIAGLDADDAASVPLVPWDGCGGTFAGYKTVIDEYVPPTGTVIDYICGLDGATLRLDVTVTALGGDTGVARTALAESVEVVADLDATFQKNSCL